MAASKERDLRPSTAASYAHNYGALQRFALNNQAHTRVALGPIYVDAVEIDGAVQQISDWSSDESGPRIVVTPNIAHVYQARKYTVVRETYRRAALALPDGWPIVISLWLLLGRRNSPHGRATGSDLVIALAKRNLRIAIVGGKDDSATLAARELRRVGAADCVAEAAPFSELSDSASRLRLLDRLAKSDCDVYLIGLGVPKQETLALELFARVKRGVIIPVGAGVEFAAGTDKRAPKALRRLGLEWLYRLSRNPRKLIGRYLAAVPYFIGVVFAALMHKKRATSGPGRTVSS